MSEGGVTVAELSRELGVPEGTLRTWRRRAGPEQQGPGGPGAVERAGLPGVRREGREEAFVHTCARLTARVIEVGVATLTAPARWVADGLRSFADDDEPSGEASAGADGSRP